MEPKYEHQCARNCGEDPKQIAERVESMGRHLVSLFSEE